MSRVVERCTVCGTEHPLAHVGPCEACGGDLGFWCTRHGAGTGWLPDRVCPVCAGEAARSAPPPPRPAPSPPPRATPAPAPTREAPRPHRRPPVDAPPMEVPPMEAPPPRRPRRPVGERPPMAPPAGPEPAGPVLRDEVARHLPGIAAGGASLAWRLLSGFFALLRATLLWGLLGGVLGLVYGLYATGTDLGGGVAFHTVDPQVLWMAVFGLLGGGAVGFLVGLARALRILFSAPRE